MSDFPKYGKTKRPEGEDDPFWLFNEYIVTHKLDGTNARLCWDGEELRFGSRKRLLTEKKDNYDFAKWADENIDVEPFEEHFEDTGPVVVFGEFFGNHIQGRIRYPDEPQFVAFDVFIGTKFLNWGDIEDVVDKLNLELVENTVMKNPHINSLQKTLKDEEEMIPDPYAIDEADKENKISEGVVVRPKVELVEPYGSQYGSRLLRKIKSKKFEEVASKGNSSGGGSGGEQKYDQEEVASVLKYVNENRIFSVLEELKEQDPDIEFNRSITGDVVRNTFEDMKAESEEELDEEILNNIAGDKIAQTYFDMIENDYLP